MISWEMFYTWHIISTNFVIPSDPVCNVAYCDSVYAKLVSINLSWGIKMSARGHKEKFQTVDLEYIDNINDF